MKAEVDQDTCIGCGLCPSICEQVFSMNDDDKAQAINSEIPSECIDDAKEARDSCPVSAIDID
jgi:ferredoxin